jgi:hypothetical protein
MTPKPLFLSGRQQSREEGRTEKGYSARRVAVGHVLRRAALRADREPHRRWSGDGMSERTCRLRRAEIMARSPAYVGALAFKRTGDPSLGNFADATVLEVWLGPGNLDERDDGFASRHNAPNGAGMRYASPGRKRVERAEQSDNLTGCSAASMLILSPDVWAVHRKFGF